MKPARNVTSRYTRHNKMRRKGTLSYTKCMCITVTMLAMASHVFLCDSFLFFRVLHGRSSPGGYYVQSFVSLLLSHYLKRSAIKKHTNLACFLVSSFS